MQVLAGEHEGKVGRVYMDFQQDIYWVDLGKEAKANDTDRFHQAQLIRAEEPNLTPLPDHSDADEPLSGSSGNGTGSNG